MFVLDQVRHFDFQFLLKADDDSFVCLARIASMLHDLDPDISSRIYAGVPTACNQVTNTDYWVRSENCTSTKIVSHRKSMHCDELIYTNQREEYR